MRNGASLLTLPRGVFKLLPSPRRLFTFPFVCISLRGKCVECPNTVWLLFLLFATALVALVALSVYLSKKRLNLAVLGIGVVSETRTPCT
jgi:hypothetical protein